MTGSFAEIRRSAPPIHAFVPGHTIRHGDVEIVNGDEVTILEPTAIDENYEGTPYSTYSPTFIEGDGTQRRPYTYKGAAPVSPHFAIVDLWWILLNDLHLYNRTVFIKANGWLFEVSPEGVTAMDGHFTKLA